MFRALTRLLRRAVLDPAQLLLPLAAPAPPPARPGPPRRLAAPPRQLAPRLPRRRRTPQEEDAVAVAKLVARHAELNVTRFGGVLRPIRVEVSRRLRARLGYYRLATGRAPALIVISRRHLRRHGWDEACHTLLHEMVHQWQQETGAPVDHGAAFRAKARAVGAVPRARRPVGSDRGVALAPPAEREAPTHGGRQGREAARRGRRRGG
jgi:SprT-like family protein